MDAFLIRLTDPKHQEYVQKNPVLRGPDVALNRELRQAWYTSLEVRKPPPAPYVHESIDGPLDQIIDERDWRAVLDTCGRLGLSEAEARGLVLGWGWKAARAPRNARRILSVGCGGGHELVVLRALFPEAEIWGVDYTVTVPSEWNPALRLSDLHTGHIEEYLASHSQRFDLVFSNHTLEHLSAPDRTLRLMREALVPGGACVSALPLEGHEANPFYDDFLAVAEGRKKADMQLDLEFINPGHAWKTNHDDLAATLHAAGFRDIRMFTRANYPSNYHRDAPMHASQFRRRKIVGKLIERVTLHPLRRALRVIYPEQLPEIVVKVYYTITGRCWFSRVQLLHELIHEVLFIGTVPL